MDAKLDIHRVPGTTNEFAIITSHCASRKIKKVIWESSFLDVRQHDTMGLRATVTNPKSKSSVGYFLVAEIEFDDGFTISNHLRIHPKDIPKPSLISRLLTNWI